MKILRMILWIVGTYTCILAGLIGFIILYHIATQTPNTPHTMPVFISSCIIGSVELYIAHRLSDD